MVNQVTYIVLKKDGFAIGEKLLHFALARLEIEYGIKPEFIGEEDEGFFVKLEDERDGSSGWSLGDGVTDPKP